MIWPLREANSYSKNPWVKKFGDLPVHRGTHPQVGLQKNMPHVARRQAWWLRASGGHAASLSTNN